jgi:hypothetical protein
MSDMIKIKSRRDQEMECALKELKIETKRYNRNDTFEKTFAKYFKKAQIRSIREAIKEAKKRLKSG